MTPEVALEKREQMIEDGFCVINDVLSEAFLQELRDESERLIAGHVQPEDVIYQGQHVNVRGDDNVHIKKLLEWEPSREALEQVGFGDFTTSGGIIILTKRSGRAGTLLAPRLDALERSTQLCTVAPNDFSQLLSHRYDTRKRMFKDHSRHPSQTG